MKDKFQKAKDILTQYNQLHLLNFYNDLTDNQKDILLNQILSINFEEILTLYNNSKIEPNYDNVTISPIPYIDKDKLSDSDFNKYYKTGIDCIKNEQLAVVTMSGGQGSRLGIKVPKGCFELDTDPPISLFEIMCNNFKRVKDLYNVTIPWYIMTSEENDTFIRTFFKQNNYFGYPSSSINFFMQENLPIIDIHGKLILEELYSIKQASNGNGNVFPALYNSGCLDRMKKDGIKWVSFCGIDNVLSRPTDSVFLGATILSGYQVGTKSIFKEIANANECIFCKQDNMPIIIDYDRITPDMENAKNDNGDFLYRDTNILSHLMSLDALFTVASKTLPYHRAYKKNTFINYEGTKEVPTSPNTFKFETFIFDAFSFFNDLFILRVNKSDEFAPIKDFTSENNPENALELYEKFWSKPELYNKYF